MENVTFCFLAALFLVVIPPSLQFPRWKNEKDALVKTDFRDLAIGQAESENLSAENRDSRSPDDFEEGDWTNIDENSPGKKSGKPKKYTILNKSNVFENSAGKMDMRIRREKDSGLVIVDFCFKSGLRNPAEVMKFLHTALNRVQHD